MVSSECEPFAKTGGLADVVDALSRALGELGHEVDVYLPRYRGLEPPAGSVRTTLAVPVARAPAVQAVERGPDDTAVVELLTGRANGYRLRLVDHPASFDRAGYYGEAGADYADNGARFALLGRAALEAIRADGGGVSVLHGHDWQAGPALLLRDLRFADEPAFEGMATVETCHNLAYHGWVPRERAWALDVPSTVGKHDGVDLLREAVSRADIVNTVSPTYARESLGEEYGAGLDDIFRARRETYLGILNGIDPRLWNPETDDALPARFTAADLSGKAEDKRELCARLRLDAAGAGERGAPLFGLVGRLDPQKGFDLLAGAAEAMLADGARMVILGTGDDRLIAGLRETSERWPGRVAILEKFDRDEARRVYAASDLLLMPSRFEPCGQSQMIAMRYGTIPVVRKTGGLADTVVDADARPDQGDGFVFEPADPAALAGAARRAIAAYGDEARWRKIVARAMSRDFSWTTSAPRYVDAYERAIAIRRGKAA